MVETAGLKDPATTRDALNADTYARVRALARARLIRSARTRTALPTAARDHALILVLGDMGLRSEEARSLLLTSIAAKRSDGLRPWLTVVGKGDKVRRLPIPTDVDEALLRWERERPPELADDPLLFPRLGRPRRDNAFPDAGGKLSGQALSDIVKPIMLAAGRRRRARAPARPAPTPTEARLCATAASSPSCRRSWGTPRAKRRASTCITPAQASRPL